MKIEFSEFCFQTDNLQRRVTSQITFLTAAFMLLFSAGCSSSTGTTYADLAAFTNTSHGKHYRTTCAATVAKQGERVSSGKYLEQSFDVRQWKGVLKPVTRTISETKLVNDLNMGNLTTLLIEARGGLGKSWLTTSLEAQICEKMPIFTVDLGAGLPSAEATGAEPGQILFDRIADNVKIPPTPQGRRDFHRLLETQPWMLLVDAVDQVDIENREPVKTEIRAIAERYKSTARLIVLSRPPVLSTDSFGIPNLDTRIAVQTITCKVTNERVAHKVGAENVEKFWAFAKTLGIDRQADTGARCTFPHMATYRDVNVVASMAKSNNFDSASFTANGGFLATRASIYGAYFKGEFALIQEKTALTPTEGVDLIHNMLIAQKPSSGTRTISFSMNDCLGALAKGHTKDTRNTCTAVLGSDIFEAGSGAAHWKFQNQSYADYFLAFWGNALLISKNQEANCAQLEKLGQFFDSNEVGSFLVGMNHGEKCVNQVIKSLCDNGCLPEDTFDLLDHGIIASAARIEILVDGDGAGGKDSACAFVTKQNLKGVIEAAGE